MIALAALAGAALLAGAIAAIAGFGIGSVLTPVLALEVGTRLAVAAVSIPHAVGTAIRFWRLRASVDRRVLRRFGLTSAAGGLVGALLQARASSETLAVVFGFLLLLASVSELSGLARRVSLGRRGAQTAGALSGVFGGLVGNQGGIRSAALLTFDLPPKSFVATATAIALLVDAARLPVYLATQARELLAIWPLVAVATAGVAAGTLAGTRVLSLLPERVFRTAVALLIGALGLYMLWTA